MEQLVSNKGSWYSHYLKMELQDIKKGVEILQSSFKYLGQSSYFTKEVLRPKEIW